MTILGKVTILVLRYGTWSVHGFAARKRADQRIIVPLVAKTSLSALAKKSLQVKLFVVKEIMQAFWFVVGMLQKNSTTYFCEFEIVQVMTLNGIHTTQDDENCPSTGHKISFSA